MAGIKGLLCALVFQPLVLATSLCLCFLLVRGIKQGAMAAIPKSLKRVATKPKKALELCTSGESGERQSLARGQLRLGLVLPLEA